MSAEKVMSLSFCPSLTFTVFCSLSLPNERKSGQIARFLQFLDVENTHDHNADDGQGDAQIVLPAELFLEEQAAPQDGSAHLTYIVYNK